jgi:hypothetical protein
VQVSLLGREVERVAERLPAGNDRHLVHRQQIAGQVRQHGVACLVVGEDPPLLLAHDLPLLKTGDNALHRVLEVGARDLVVVESARKDRGLVRDVLELGAGQARRLPRDRP